MRGRRSLSLRLRLSATIVILAGLLSGAAPVRQDGGEPTVNEMIEGGIRVLHESVRRSGEYAGWSFWGLGLFPDTEMSTVIAVTSVCAEVLLVAPGWDEDPARAGEIRGATRLVLDTTMEALGLDAVARKGWALAYGLRFLLRLQEMNRVPTGMEEAVEEQIEAYIREMEDGLLPRGSKRAGWYYQSSPSFITAPVLVSLQQAHRQGKDVCMEAVRLALDYQKGARIVETGAFRYLGTGPLSPDDPPIEHVKATPQGAMARSASCEYALYVWGRASESDLARAVGHFFRYWDLLIQEWTPDSTGSHNSTNFQIGPQYILYGHHYAGLATEHLLLLPRAAYRAELARKLRAIRLEDGSWNDMHESTSVATGLALRALLAHVESPQRYAALPEVRFVRGDANQDGTVDLSDATVILTKLYIDGDLRICPMDTADVNDSGVVDMSDAVYLLNFLFTGGREPAAPYPDAGVDPTEDGLHH